MKLKLLLYNNYMMLSLIIYFIKKTNSIIRFCCEFQFFIFFVCAFFNFVLFFFWVNAFFVVISKITFRCFFLSWEIYFHILIFFIFRFDFVMTKNEITSRDDENEKKNSLKTIKIAIWKRFSSFSICHFFF